MPSPETHVEAMKLIAASADAPVDPLVAVAAKYEAALRGELDTRGVPIAVARTCHVAVCHEPPRQVAGIVPEETLFFNVDLVGLPQMLLTVQPDGTPDEISFAVAVLTRQIVRLVFIGHLGRHMPS